MWKTSVASLAIAILLSGFASASVPIEVTQGEQVHLTLKLVNVGETPLQALHATFARTPEWVHPNVTETPVHLRAASPDQARPTAHLPFVFQMDREAPVGLSQPLPIQIRSASGEIWTREIQLSVQPRPRPTTFAALPNYPNPFNPETWIPYQLAQASDVTLRIYDATGQLVRTLVLGHQEADFYTTRDQSAHWDGRNASGEPVASGLYFYHLQAGKQHAMRKMLVLK